MIFISLNGIEMRAIYENIKEDARVDKDNPLLLVYNVDTPSFDFMWHYHLEYELTLIVNGHGKRIVGDNYETFVPGDLVLFGSNLPHTYEGKQAGNVKPLKSVVIQFSGGLFTCFKELGVFALIQQMLDKSTSGLFFQNSGDVQQLIQDLPNRKGVQKILDLILILDKLSVKDSTSLATLKYKPLKGQANEQRINIVCNFIQDNFREPITINDAAAMIHLSPSAFCKFFKRAMCRTFTDYMNEIRISRACIELIETDSPIVQISDNCGFNSSSYFIRIFTKKKGISPREYRKKIS